MTDTEQKARRERFEKVARQYMGKFPTLYDLEQPFKFGPDGDGYLEDSIQFAWEMWREAGQTERREKTVTETEIKTLAHEILDYLEEFGFMVAGETIPTHIAKMIEDKLCPK